MSEQRRLIRLALASLNDEDCPPTEELAAYALGLLQGTDQLRVAAHARGCPLCQELIVAATPPPQRRPARRSIATLVPGLQALGLRSTSERQQVRQYVAADLVIELMIGPPDGEAWEITGQVLRGGVSLAGCAVQLQRRRGRPQHQISDEAGFFSFAGLRSGTYRLTVVHEQIQVEIRDLLMGPGG